jgi:hypothetical protein
MTNQDQAAKELAEKHYQIETGVTQIFRIKKNTNHEANSVEPIILLEVNQNTVASGILPLYFGPIPAAGIPFPSVIVEITPDELCKIQNQELKLPDGWVLGDMIPKPAAEALP